MPVPTTGNFNMFGTANTTIQGAIVEGGASGASTQTDFNALISLSDPEKFNPEYSGPVREVSDVNRSLQYRDYPMLSTPLTIGTNLGTGFASSAVACTNSGSPATVYISLGGYQSFYTAFIDGKRLWANSSLTTPFNGGNLWFKSSLPADAGGIFQVGTDGFIQSFNNGDTCTTPLVAPTQPFTLTWSTSVNFFTSDGAPSNNSGCTSAGWVLSNNNYTIRFNLADSSTNPSCGGTCAKIQRGSATATISTGGAAYNMELNFVGMAETQDKDYENIRFYINGGTYNNKFIARATSPGGKTNNCTMGSVLTFYEENKQNGSIPGLRNPIPLTASTTYTFTANFDSADARWHKNAYYEITLKFKQI